MIITLLINRHPTGFESLLNLKLKFYTENNVTLKPDFERKKEAGGGRWIRTTVRETRADLQSAAIDRSAIPPYF